MGIPRGEDRFLEIDGMKLHYVEWGRPEAPPLVLLHGMASFARIWDLLAPDFEPEYRVIALDWRGHGDSDWAAGGQYPFTGYGADLAGLIAALDLSQATVVGHSLGGLMGLYYAAECPDRLRAVVAADFRTGIEAHEIEQSRQQSQRPYRAFASEVEILDRFAASLAPTSAAPETLRRLGRQGVKQTESGEWIFKFDRGTLAINPIEPYAVLARVTVPALIMRGQDSPLMSAAALSNVGAVMAGASVVEIPGAGHHLFLDRPDEFAAAVKTFLHEH